MNRKFILARCICGFATGGVLGRRISCGRCGSNVGLTTESSYANGAELAQSVMLANTPEELRTELEERLSKAEKSVSHGVRGDGINGLIRSLSNIADDNGLLTIDQLEKLSSIWSINRKELDRFLSIAEAEGLLSRTGTGTWILMES